MFLKILEPCDFSRGRFSNISWWKEMFIEVYFDDYEKFLYMSDALRKGDISNFKKYEVKFEK